MAELQLQGQALTAPEESAAPLSRNEKLYSILAYMSFFWLVGMFASPEKHNKSVRFHVGQGIALRFASIAVLLIVGVGGGLLGKLIGRLTGISFNGGFHMGWDAFTFPVIFSLVLFTILLAAELTLFVLTVKGMVNAAKGRNERLPIVGKFVFYK
ncbi:MAG: hypothetical protein LBJ12_05480 [Oscillospiraceae bacterium]|jgi:uncharacterized membrane protein|nr:hypothetical protein [Oscillospiraceae bacterium]